MQYYGSTIFKRSVQFFQKGKNDWRTTEHFPSVASGSSSYHSCWCLNRTLMPSTPITFYDYQGPAAGWRRNQLGSVRHEYERPRPPVCVCVFAHVRSNLRVRPCSSSMFYSSGNQRLMERGGARLVSCDFWLAVWVSAVKAACGWLDGGEEKKQNLNHSVLGKFYKLCA